jgi:hypothetical protein
VLPVGFRPTVATPITGSLHFATASCPYIARHSANFVLCATGTRTVIGHQHGLLGDFGLLLSTAEHCAILSAIISTKCSIQRDDILIVHRRSRVGLPGQVPVESGATEKRAIVFCTVCVLRTTQKILYNLFLLQKSSYKPKHYFSPCVF